MFIFLLFYVTGVEKWNLFFFQIMILEHLHFCLTIHACVSHLLHGQPHLLEWYYRNCLIGTHVSTSSIRMINFFTLQCELFKSCNVSNNASLVSTRTGRGGGQPNVDKPGQGEGVPKILKFVRTSCMDDPYINNPTTNSGTCC